ncbi:tryptophan synthase alpha chain [Fluviicoccus keumensis]|uniref:Tryptophan synthase alpha chain n=1 Tax=Fluviicoccus keumensis TaxID=1435465 RepID=A0A4Q7Z8R0_9GAMM|nr:tryptophan synthase subunit alpha [Fluviicoccus keumensis]RZU46880.1 tryptophan synthase alpha chain [Fluviicoccus keumensis]
MSRIKACFAALKQQNRKALIPYITAGDPHPDHTVGQLHALVEGGADILELGIPFSDPMADGPTITKAHERALVHHTSLKRVLAMVSEFRRKDDKTPVVLMGYLNPLEIMGYDAFAKAAAAAGVDGVLTVDLPPEESEILTASLKQNGLDPIFLLAPTTTPERIHHITAAASGYVYYVSLKGVTGSNTLDIDEVAERIAAIRQASDLPIGVGFGIKDAETAAAVARHADGVVVGSALVSRIAELQDVPEAIPGVLSGILRDLRQAMDAV